jgi:hypothetical protein
MSSVPRKLRLPSHRVEGVCSVGGDLHKEQLGQDHWSSRPPLLFAAELVSIILASFFVKANRSSSLPILLLLRPSTP